MSGEIAAARAHPAVVVSIVIASVAVTLAALVAIAHLLGWVPASPSLPTTPVGMASPAQQVAGTANDLALLPGESVVTAPESPKPVTPSYAKPATRPPNPRSAPEPAPRPAAPVRPAPPKVASAPQRLCVNCATVAAITAYGGGDWDVRVRFQDGSAETLRYREPPQLRVGERVRLEGGRLVRE